MSDTFDPYHVWLGIPPESRPPTHYELLGISPKEQERAVIEAAVLRQSGYVRNFQIGKYGKDAAKVLNEIGAAKACLIDPVAVVPTSEETANDWRYTTARPADGWMESGFDDSTWTLAPAGFGANWPYFSDSSGTVRTEWTTPDIWLRRAFDLPPSTAGAPLLHFPRLVVLNDDHTEVYINGVMAASITYSARHYDTFAISGGPCGDAARQERNGRPLHEYGRQPIHRRRLDRPALAEGGGSNIGNGSC